MSSDDMVLMPALSPVVGVQWRQGESSRACRACIRTSALRSSRHCSGKGCGQEGVTREAGTSTLRRPKKCGFASIPPGAREEYPRLLRAGMIGTSNSRLRVPYRSRRHRHPRERASKPSGQVRQKGRRSWSLSGLLCCLYSRVAFRPLSAILNCFRNGSKTARVLPSADGIRLYLMFRLMGWGVGHEKRAAGLSEKYST